MLETLRPILRAAGIAGFTVGLILFLLNPPSLSGFGGLVMWTLGALAVVFMAAWATVGLIGRDSMSEEEVERLAVRAGVVVGHLLGGALLGKLVRLVVPHAYSSSSSALSGSSSRGS